MLMADGKNLGTINQEPCGRWLTEKDEIRYRPIRVAEG